MCSRARGVDVSLRDVTIAQMGNWGLRVRMMSCTESARRILGILKKVRWVENWTPNEKGWLSLVRGGLGQVSHEMGDRRKSQNRKNVYLSPCVEEPLNSKVIKSFVPELRSRKCFSCFEIHMFYVYMLETLWTFDVHFTHSRIWLWYWLSFTRDLQNIMSFHKREQGLYIVLRYVNIYISSSSLSRTDTTEFPDSSLHTVPTVHHSWKVL